LSALLAVAYHEPNTNRNHSTQYRKGQSADQSSHTARRHGQNADHHHCPQNSTGQNTTEAAMLDSPAAQAPSPALQLADQRRPHANVLL